MNHKFRPPVGGQVLGAEKHMIRQIYVSVFTGVLHQIAGAMTRPIITENAEVTMYTPVAIVDRAEEISIEAMKRLGYELKPNPEVN